MIYDCFTFFNELELLDLRLHELNGVVDKFVIVEGTVTFTNKPKKLDFRENAAKFSEFKNKIIYISVTDSPNVIGNPWIIEMHQFNAITRGLTNCQPNDTILLSNVDEIPKPESIMSAMEKPGKIKAFRQILSYYYLNLRAINQPWFGTRMVKFADMKSFENPYIIRHAPVDTEIPDGGWHFSYMGGADKIREKIFAFSHQEYNNPKFNTPEKIRLSIINRADLFDRGLKFETSDLNDLPLYVRNHPEKYNKFILSENLNSETAKTAYLKGIDTIKGTLRKLRS
jgi:beta-1,4-mannosyl-glycoprotein beta-1,4-N-acetylglucosaminyltransferase